MIAKKILEETSLKIIENLDKVFESVELRSHLNEKIFFELVLKHINYLYSIKKTLKKDEIDATNFVVLLNTITGKVAKLEVTELKDEFELKDDINYMNVYVFNIYKKDIHDFPADFKEFVNDGTPGQENPNISQEFHKPDYTAKPASSQPFQQDQNFTVSPEQIQEQIYLQTANARLRNDIATGTFYIYDSKPKSFLILKRLFYAFLILVGLSFLAPAISIFMAVGIQYTVPGATEPTTLTSNVATSQALFNIVYAVLFSSFAIFGLVKKNKSDNQTYHFSWVNVFLLVFVFFFNFFQQINAVIQIIPQLDTIVAEQNFSGASLAFRAFYISYLVSGCLIAAAIGFAILVAVLNPKRDVQRINAKLQQYIEEVKRVSKPTGL